MTTSPGLSSRELSVWHLDDGRAFDDQMVEHKVLRARSKPGRHQIRRRHRQAPRSREFSVEEHGAVELDSAQDLGDGIHVVLRPLDSLQSSAGVRQSNPDPLGRSSKSWRRSGMAVPAEASHNCSPEGDAASLVTGESNKRSFHESEQSVVGKRRLSPKSPPSCVSPARRSLQSMAITPPLRVLDLGCGDGTTAIPLARTGAEVTGIDIARNLVEAGKNELRKRV